MDHPVSRVDAAKHRYALEMVRDAWDALISRRRTRSSTLLENMFVLNIRRPYNPHTWAIATAYIDLKTISPFTATAKALHRYHPLLFNGMSIL